MKSLKKYQKRTSIVNTSARIHGELGALRLPIILTFLAIGMGIMFTMQDFSLSGATVGLKTVVQT